MPARPDAHSMLDPAMNAGARNRPTANRKNARLGAALNGSRSRIYKSRDGKFPTFYFDSLAVEMLITCRRFSE